MFGRPSERNCLSWKLQHNDNKKKVKQLSFSAGMHYLPQQSAHVRESKTVLDSGFHAVDSGFQSSLSVELGFRIPIVSGIPDSLSCIPDSKTQDSKFYKHKFSCFRNLGSLKWRDQQSNWNKETPRAALARFSKRSCCKTSPRLQGSGEIEPRKACTDPPFVYNQSVTELVCFYVNELHR